MKKTLLASIAILSSHGAFGTIEPLRLGASQPHDLEKLSARHAQLSDEHSLPIHAPRSEMVHEVKSDISSLNNLIALFKKSGSIPVNMQEEYKNRLQSLKEDLATLKARGVKVDTVERDYLDVYEQWESQVIPPKKPHHHAKQKTTKHLTEYQKERNAKVKELYAWVKDEVQQALGSFEQELGSKLNTLGDYSDTSVEEMQHYLANLQRSFKGSMDSVNSAVISAFNTFLKQQGKAPQDPRELSSDERILLNGVHRVTSDALEYVRSFIVSLTSKAILTQTGYQLKESVAEFEKMQEQEFHRQNIENAKNMEQNWFEAVADVGQDFLKNFADQAKIAILKEMATQKALALQHFGDKLASIPEKYAKDLKKK